MNIRISSWQLFILVFMTSFCVTPFGFDALHADAGALMWQASALQLSIAGVGGLGVVLLLSRCQGMTFDQMVCAIAGSALARVYAVMLGLYLYFWGPIGNAKTVLRMIESTTLPATDPLLIYGALAVAGVYGAYYGGEVVARTAEMYALVLIPVIAVLGVVPYIGGDLTRVMTFAVPELGPAAADDLISFGLGLRGFILALALAGLVAGAQQEISRAVLAGTFGAGLLVMLMVVVPHTMFAHTTVARFQFPVLEAMDTVEARSLGINSLLPVTMVAWYIITWVVVAATLYAAAYLWSVAFGIANFRWLLPFMVVVAAAVALYPLSRHFVDQSMMIWVLLGYGVGVVGPWLLLGAAWLRGVSGDSGA